MQCENETLVQDSVEQRPEIFHDENNNTSGKKRKIQKIVMRTHKILWMKILHHNQKENFEIY